MKRNSKMDNLRSLLIFCVVFGHLLELFPGSSIVSFIYRIIYSFHMPAFLFLSGYFARPGRPKTVRRLLVLYVFFQTAYLVFQHFIAADGSTLVLQYTTPYWLLWYLLTIIFYYLILPILETDNIKTMGKVLLVTVILSILAGFDSSVGYYMSLSRTLVFLPFFMLGFYASKAVNTEKFKAAFSHRSVWGAVCVAGVVMGAFYIVKAQVPNSALYGSFSYAASGTTPVTRIILFVVALCWIGLFLNVVPNVNIPVLTGLGGNTLPIFLLHGFIVKVLEKCAVFRYTGSVNIALAAVIACAMLLLLGNPFIGRIFNGRSVKK